MIKSLIQRIEAEPMRGMDPAQKAQELGLIFSFRKGLTAIEGLGAVTLAAGIGNSNNALAGVGGGVLAAAGFAERVLSGFEAVLNRDPASN